jgi:hypothetical protein
VGGSIEIAPFARSAYRDENSMLPQPCGPLDDDLLMTLPTETDPVDVGAKRGAGTVARFERARTSCDRWMGVRIPSYWYSLAMRACCVAESPYAS